MISGPIGIYLLILVKYREVRLELWWRRFFSRHPGGVPPFPETPDERAFQRTWAGVELAKFAGYTHTAARVRQVAEDELDRVRNQQERFLADLCKQEEVMPGTPTVGAVDFLSYREDLKSARANYDHEKEQEEIATRVYNELCRLFAAMTMLPHDFEDAERFRYTHVPADFGEAVRKGPGPLENEDSEGGGLSSHCA